MLPNARLGVPAIPIPKPCRLHRQDDLTLLTPLGAQCRSCPGIDQGHVSAGVIVAPAGVIRLTWLRKVLWPTGSTGQRAVLLRKAPYPVDDDPQTMII
jgi:hypothetical protein